MDGLLVDTEDAHRESYKATLEQFGISITDAFYNDFWIRQGKGIADYIRENNLDLKPDYVRSIKREMYQNRIKRELTIYDGVPEKLGELSGLYPLALLTSAYRSDTELILEISGLKKYFEIVVTGTDVKKHKPDPEGILLINEAWNYLWDGERKILLPDIVMIGDAEKDIIASKEAGAKSIAIPSEYTKNNDFSNADAVLYSISMVTPELINRL